MDKCIWCGERKQLFEDNITIKGVQYSYFFCSKEHFEKTVKFLRYEASYAIHFFVGLILTCGVGIPLSFFDPWLGLLITFFGLGITIIIFPFATPQTKQLLGIKKSITVVRVLAISFFIIGITAFLLSILI
ncbi:MAG: hypothetical protein ACTSQY_02110 [Candidatus Odinarchaeia archaeon]